MAEKKRQYQVDNTQVKNYKHKQYPNNSIKSTPNICACEATILV